MKVGWLLKKLIKENNSASKNKPELVKLLDENEARDSGVNPENIYDAIADAIVKNIVHNDKRTDSNNTGVENIEIFLAEAEVNYKRKEEDDIHKNRMAIKERLKKEGYNGVILAKDEKKQSKSSKKK